MYRNTRWLSETTSELLTRVRGSGKRPRGVSQGFTVLRQPEARADDLPLFQAALTRQGVSVAPQEIPLELIDSIVLDGREV